MKNISIITVLVVSFLFSTQIKARGNDSLFCLKIKGRITNASEGYTNGCKIELLNSKGLVDSLILRNKDRFSFLLKRNTYYAIRVSKAGYVSRLISINTEFPDEIADICEFSFNTSLISEEEAAGMNKDALDFPVAIVHFHEKTETFVHNKEYSENLKKELSNKDEVVCTAGTLASADN